MNQRNENCSSIPSLGAREHDPRRRQFLSAALSGAATGVLITSAVNEAAATAAAAATGETADAPVWHREALDPTGAPAADSGYSPAILAHGARLLFISGQGPPDVQADMETQIRQTFDRIGILLQAAGATFANVVIVRSYWVHLARDLPLYRKVRKDYLVAPYPASTAVGTTELAIPGLELEIEVTAVL